MENHSYCKCRGCGRFYSSHSNLRRHVRKDHPEKLKELAPTYYKNSKNFTFTCGTCLKNFSRRKHLTSHVRTHNNERTSDASPRSDKKCRKCPLCDYETSSTNDILKHFEIHDVFIETEEKMFSSLEDFQQWKNELEQGTNSKFVKRTMESNGRSVFVCHRSGFFVSKGKGIRHTKILGSNKINAFCPASIKLTLEKDGKYNVLFIKTHVGHQNDLGHLTLSLPERKCLATKISSKIPFGAILDEVADSIPESDPKRLHLLTRKDLHNIERCFNLSSVSVRHPNDALSVEAWVNEMRRKDDCVLFYKPQGAVDEFLGLKTDDFVLMIMTTAQCEFLNKYGTDCICVDSTHGLNSYDFELSTVLVLDDLREGFPCAFLISNRTDKQILKLFFSRIKSLSGEISPRVFMSDLADNFYNAWEEEMGAPGKRLFCTWHVDRAWKKNLSKIKSREKQLEVYQKLRALLEERDSSAFEIMINNFCNDCSDSEAKDFLSYFKQHYLENRRCWAYCYRLHSGLNTNMHLERMHGTLKYIYLNGKKVKRLDKAITAIMKFVRDKLINRLIVAYKGKLCNKIKEIRHRHKTMESLDTTLVIKTTYGWEVASKSTQEIYVVQESEETCNCNLVCTICNICIHKYSCSCLDSAVKFNMCKHAHLIAKFREENSINTTEIASESSSTKVVTVTEDINGENRETENDDGDSDHLFIHCNDNDETPALLSEISRGNKKPKHSVEKEKEEILQYLRRQLDKCDSPSKIRLVRKALAPLSPTLNAVVAQNKTGRDFLETPKNMPHNAKISAQRRLWSTKKKTQKKVVPLKKQTSTNTTAIQLLHGPSSSSTYVSL